MFRRGAEILAFGFAFRLQEFLIAWGWAPWSDILRVDILNIIGISMMLMALLCGLALFVWGRTDSSLAAEQNSAPASAGKKTIGSIPIVLSALSIAALIAVMTPPLYTSHRPTWLPWYLESYIDGCHNLGAPQSWLFSIFPWSAFAFAGLAAGFVLFSDAARAHTSKALALFAVAGAAAIAVAYRLDHSQLHFYAVYDSSTRTNLSAGLLGPHRIRLRALFHSAEACRVDPECNAWLARDLPFHASPLACAHENRLEEIPLEESAFKQAPPPHSGRIT